MHINIRVLGLHNNFSVSIPVCQYVHEVTTAMAAVQRSDHFKDFRLIGKFCSFLYIFSLIFEV